jgi:hypothetical protein
VYSDELSRLVSPSLLVMPLEDDQRMNLKRSLPHTWNSSNYIKDGIHALNTAFVKEGHFHSCKKRKAYRASCLHLSYYGCKDIKHPESATLPDLHW